LEDELTLVFPAQEHKEAAWAYRQEYFDYGEKWIHGSGGLSDAVDYESWLAKITSYLLTPQNGWGNCHTFYAFVGDKIVGTIQIRQSPNESLLREHGNIGYGVLPSERRRGYASKMLMLALEKCRQFGVEKVYLTCDVNNISSAKTMQKCGAVLENEFMDEHGNMNKRFWITL
jgi:predicted acetyltransferase